MHKLVSAAILSATYLTIAILGHASTVVGSQVTATVDYPTLGTVTSNVITGTDPFTIPSGSLTSTVPPIFVINANVDVGPTSIEVAYTEPATALTATFNGYVFDFANAPAITGASLDPSSTFNSSQVGVGFNPDEVTINVEGLSVTPSSVILVDLTFAPTTTTATPEPQSFALLLAGLGVTGVIGILRLRGQSRAVLKLILPADV